MLPTQRNISVLDHVISHYVRDADVSYGLIFSNFIIRHVHGGTDRVKRNWGVAEKSIDCRNYYDKFHQFSASHQGVNNENF